MAPNSIFLSVLFLLFLSICPSLGSDDVIRFAKNHLMALGYMSRDYTSIDDNTYDEALVSALRKYQTFYGLNVTGRMEPDTLTMMRRPRCGVPNYPSTYDDPNSKLHYSFYPGRPVWPADTKNLKYAFHNNPPISSVVAKGAIARAFASWSRVSGFTFEEVVAVTRNQSQIHMGFYRGEHGDRIPFDGRGGELAHSFPPPHGILHFDADEEWGTVEAPNIVDLESVALHEIGHILGLAHSTVLSAVMYDLFSYGQIKRQLHQDDINGIHALYGH